MTLLQELSQIVNTYRWGTPDEFLYKLDEFILLKNKEIEQKENQYINCSKYSEPF